MEERKSDRQTRVKKDKKDCLRTFFRNYRHLYGRVEYVIFLTILFCHLEEVEGPNILSLQQLLLQNANI